MSYWPKEVRTAVAELITAYNTNDSDSIRRALTESSNVSFEDVLRCLLDLVLALAGERHNGDVEAGLLDVAELLDS
jgi:hypothetical protein